MAFFSEDQHGTSSFDEGTYLKALRRWVWNSPPEQAQQRAVLLRDLLG